MENTKTIILEGTEFTIESILFEGDQLTYIHYRNADGKLRSQLVLAGFEYVTKNI